MLNGKRSAGTWWFSRLQYRPSASHVTLENTYSGKAQHILKHHLFFLANRPTGHFIPSTLLVLGEISFLSLEVSDFFHAKDSTLCWNHSSWILVQKLVKTSLKSLLNSQFWSLVWTCRLERIYACKRIKLLLRCDWLIWSLLWCAVAPMYQMKWPVSVFYSDVHAQGDQEHSGAQQLK